MLALRRTSATATMDLVQGGWWIKPLWYALFSGDISVGRHSKVAPGATLAVEYGGRITIGDRCVIHPGAKILTYGGTIKIGNDVSLNPYSVVYGKGGLQIDDGVRIGAHVAIVPSNHTFSRLDVPIFEQGEVNLGVTIGRDTWIGTGAKVLDGVSIGEGCVIGAGAVLTRSTEPFGIYAGVPARKIGRRGMVVGLGD